MFSKFKKLFSNGYTSNNLDVQQIYNNGVIELTRGNLDKAIHLLKQVENEHMSAAYNLGLIYLDGYGQMMPDAIKARAYFQLADRLGHPKARETADVIGFEGEREIKEDDFQSLLLKSISQWCLGNQNGNLAYIIANEIIYRRSFGYLDRKKALEEFLNYEVWCIRTFGNDEIKHFYNLSKLRYVPDQWSGVFEVASISESFNDNAMPLIFNVANMLGKQPKLEELGIARLIAVDYVYQYFKTL